MGAGFAAKGGAKRGPNVLIYKVVLVVVLSTAPGMHEAVIYQFPTWEACKVKEAELIEGMKTQRKPENVTVDCRRDVQINMGSR
jgi:hypothetical protein